MPIRDISVGMSVWSRDATDGSMAWQRVLAAYSNDYPETVSIEIHDVETGAAQTIRSNRVHPFFVQTTREVPASSEGHIYKGPLSNGHWIDAVDLRPGDRLLNDDATWAEVAGVMVEALPLRAYNLTVETAHTYFVAGDARTRPVWVHNTCDVSDLINGSTPGRTTSGRTTLYLRGGGFAQANADFDALNPSGVRTISVSSGGAGRVGTLPDGRTVIVRETSSDGTPTLEIQGGAKEGEVSQSSGIDRCPILLGELRAVGSMFLFCPPVRSYLV